VMPTGAPVIPADAGISDDGFEIPAFAETT
jgi:hypothetical protein